PGGEDAVDSFRHPDPHMQVLPVPVAPDHANARRGAGRSLLGDDAPLEPAAHGGARRQRHVELEVLAVDRRHRLREREALDAQEVEGRLPVRQDALVAGPAGVGAHEDVDPGGGYRRGAGQARDDGPAPGPDRGRRLRGMELGAVPEVRAHTGLPRAATRARGRLAVAVEHALRGRGHGAAPGSRARLPTVEDPAPQADDAVSGAGPGPGGVGAGLPFEVNLAVTVPG